MDNRQNGFFIECFLRYEAVTGDGRYGGTIGDDRFPVLKHRYHAKRVTLLRWCLALIANTMSESPVVVADRSSGDVATRVAFDPA